MDNSLSSKLTKLAARIRKSSSQLFTVSPSRDHLLPSSSPSLNKCLSENNLCLRNESAADAYDKGVLPDPCNQCDHSDTSTPSTPRRCRRKKTRGYHHLSSRRKSSPSGIKKSASLMEYIFKKPVPSSSTISLNRSSCMLSMSSGEELSQGEQVFLFTVEDTDSCARSNTQKEFSVLSPNSMDVESLQFPQGTVKPSQRRRYSLTKSHAKEKAMPVALLSSLQTVNLSSGCSRVESWAREFDNLLSDPAGLQTFTEFLKKEFSHENIYFWCMCEKYRMTTDLIERRTIAKEIVERHLDTGALEPVNVDSIARSSAQESLHLDDEDQVLDINMFIAPQKQIYNLMKFDSYGRFLKSDLYNTCLTADLKGKKLPLPGLDKMDRELFTGVQKHTADERRIPVETRTRRRSFLPWPHKSKSKEKLISKSTEELDKRERKKSLLEILTPSVSEYQLSHDRKGNSRSCSNVCTVYENTSASSLCRITLPDSSRTLASLEPGQTVRGWVEGLLKRRGMVAYEFVVLDVESGVELDTHRDCAKLANREVTVKSVNVSYPIDDACDTLNICEIGQRADAHTSSGDCDEILDFPINYSSLTKPPDTDAKFSKSCHLNKESNFQVRCKEEKEDSCCFDNNALEGEGE